MLTWIKMWQIKVIFFFLNVISCSSWHNKQNGNVSGDKIIGWKLLMSLRENEKSEKWISKVTLYLSFEQANMPHICLSMLGFENCEVRSIFVLFSMGYSLDWVWREKIKKNLKSLLKGWTWEVRTCGRKKMNWRCDMF